MKKHLYLISILSLLVYSPVFAKDIISKSIETLQKSSSKITQKIYNISDNFIQENMIKEIESSEFIQEASLIMASQTGDFSIEDEIDWMINFDEQYMASLPLRKRNYVLEERKLKKIKVQNKQNIRNFLEAEFKTKSQNLAYKLSSESLDNKHLQYSATKFNLINSLQYELDNDNHNNVNMLAKKIKDEYNLEIDDKLVNFAIQNRKINVLRSLIANHIREDKELPIKSVKVGDVKFIRLIVSNYPESALVIPKDILNKYNLHYTK